MAEEGERARAPGASTDAPPQPARRLGRYLLLRALGRGGMGTVYAAYDEHLDRKIALKVLSDDGANLEARTRLLREAQTLARLAHPNVVTVHDVGVHDREIYIAMEFITGVTLRTWLMERRRSHAEILAAFTAAGRGLAAAHALGIVHRDFKPDNVMVDTSGRIVVFDFGLARQAGELPPLPVVDVRGDGAGVDVTLTGTVLGTPAYMAPEQHLGGATDARTDVFALCVALHEALCGERPFPGRTPDEIANAVIRGELRPPPRGALPGWLRRVVATGLSLDPAIRWPTMNALLDALAADPSTRRRRLLRGTGLVVLVPALVVLAVLGAVRLAERWAHERREAAALAGWEGTRARIDAYEAAGRHEHAELLFQAFVSADESRGTRALPLAWLTRGRRALARGDEADGTEAFAQAYTSADDPALEAESLTELARLFHERGRGGALASALQALDEIGAPETPERLALRAHRAILDRDLRGALALLARLGDQAPPELIDARPVVAALAGATSIGHPALHAVFADTDDDGADELVLVTTREATVLDRRFALVAHHSLPGEMDHALPFADRPLLIAHGGGELGLFRLGDELEELWRGPGPSWPFSTASVDLDADGQRELYIGLAAYRRGLHRLRLADGPSASLDVADPGIDAAHSDVEAILPVDLDGDGALELVVAVGPWEAYDLRVFSTQGGRLRLLDRRELGHVRALAPLRAADGALLIAATVDHAMPSRVVFPTPPHGGAPPGIHLFRWQSGRLEPAQHLPALGAPAGDFRYLEHMAAADVDGDGLDDLVVSEERERTGRHLAIHRQRPDGGFAGLSLQGLTFLVARELDGTPGLELLASETRNQGIWVLGLGDAVLPPALADPHPTEPPPPGLEPALDQRWRRTNRLEAAGLPRLAADGLRAAALLAESPRSRRLALARAAELLADDGDDRGAVDLFRQIASDPDLPARTRGRAARSFARLGRFAEAAATLEASPTAPEPLGPDDLSQSVLHRLTDPEGTVELRFDRPLDRRWQILDPLAFIRRPADRRVDLIPTASPRPLARLPLVWDGGPLVVDVDLALLTSEFAGQLVLAITDDLGRTIAGVGLTTRGGGRIYRHDLVCLAPGPGRYAILGQLPFVDTDTPHDLRLLLTVLPDRGLALCRAPGVGAGVASLTHAPEPGRTYALELRSDRDDAFSTELHVALRALTIRGAHLPADTPPPPERALAWELAEGELERLVTPADPAAAPEIALWRAVAALATDDLDGARAALAIALREGPVGDLRAPLLGLLRRDSARLAPLLRPLLGDAYFDLAFDAWDAVVHHHPDDPRVLRESLDALVELDTDPELPARPAVVALLAQRGRIWLDLGELDRAERALARARGLADALPELPAALRFDLLRDLARVRLGRGDPEAARDLLQRAIASAPARESAVDHLRRRPELAALLDRAP